MPIVPSFAVSCKTSARTRTFWFIHAGVVRDRGMYRFIVYIRSPRLPPSAPLDAYAVVASVHTQASAAALSRRVLSSRSLSSPRDPPLVGARSSAAAFAPAKCSCRDGSSLRYLYSLSRSRHGSRMHTGGPQQFRGGRRLGGLHIRYKNIYYQGVTLDAGAGSEELAGHSYPWGRGESGSGAPRRAA